MKLEKFILVFGFLTLSTIGIYAQVVEKHYIHLLTKEEAAIGIHIGCGCSNYQNILWRSVGTTMDGLPLDRRRETSPLVNPPRTEVYQVGEMAGGSFVPRERHTVVVIDLQISIQGTNVVNAMAGRPITFIGELVNVGYLTIYNSKSIVTDWILKAVTTASPNRVIEVKLMNDTKTVFRQVKTQSDDMNSDLIDVWKYTYTVNLQGLNCSGSYNKSMGGRQPRPKFTFGSVGTHARGLIGTITHENYHKKVFTTDGWGFGTTYIHTDSDFLPDLEEDRPGSLSNPERHFFPCSYKNLPDTYDLETHYDERRYVDSGDQELRCLVLQYNITNSAAWTAHYFESKDWTAVEANLNW